MRKLMVTTMLSLDGVMQAPGGPEEDPSDGFAFGGWTAPFVDEEGAEAKAAEVSGPIDLLLGRRTYEIFAGYWPNDAESAIGKPFNDATKYVASRSRPSLDWGPAVLIEDAAEGVAALKQEDGPELQVHGSGHGKRLFDDGTIPATLRLVDSKVSATGVFMGTYEPAGEVVTDSF
jgi:dihydrofolate reductase